MSTSRNTTTRTVTRRRRGTGGGGTAVSAAGGRARFRRWRRGSLGAVPVAGAVGARRCAPAGGGGGPGRCGAARLRAAAGQRAGALALDHVDQDHGDVVG